MECDEKVYCLYCVPNQNFLSKYGEISNRSSQDTNQQRMKTAGVLVQIARMQLLVNPWHMELRNITKNCAASIECQKKFSSEIGEILY